MSQRAPTRRTGSAWQAALAQLLVWLLIAPPAWSVSDGTVVAGHAPIISQGNDTTIHAADGSIIEWQDFDIGVGETVRFIQPNELARVLNRVVTADPTQIDGNLFANGRVYILNPYGVYFGETAIVDVGHLVAAAGNLSNADFLAGIDRFTELGGRIENLGQIHANSVGLFGASVANHGLISAPDGAIWMLAGDEVIVARHGSPIVVRIGAPGAAQPDHYAVENTGSLEAAGGSVRMAAGDLLSLAVRNSGRVRADQVAIEGGARGRVQIEGRLDVSNSDGVGGEVDVRGDLVVLEHAQIDASGSTGGGRVHIGGGWQGALAEGEQASRASWIDTKSVVKADATHDGDGGEVVVWSDGNSYVYGQLSARGAAGGNGGRIETSGKRFLDVRGTPDLSAPGGDAGTWLIDPSNIRIVADLGGVDPDDPRVLSDEFDLIAMAPPAEGIPEILPEADDSLVEASSLAGALARGFQVILSTENVNDGGSQQGNITFEEALDFSSQTGIQPGTTATLELRAANDILVGSTLDPIGISDATAPNSNLDLSVDLLAGDPDQPESATAETDSQKIEIHGDVDVRGTIRLAGAQIELDGNLTARSEATDLFLLPGENSPIVFNYAVGIEADERGISTQGITTDGGAVLLFSRSDGLEPVTMEIDVAGPVATEGGAFAAIARGGDVQISGDINTTSAAGDADGSIGIDAALVVTNDETTPFETSGGHITLDPVSLSAGSGSITVNADHSIDSKATILSDGALITIGVDDVEDTQGELVEVTGRRIDVTGDITNPGGNIQILTNTSVADPNFSNAGDVSIHVQADLDASVGSDSLGDDDGDVLVEGPGLVDIGDNVLRGDDVRIASGLDGTGNLTFGAGAVIDARSVRIEAGDGYTPEPDAETGATIDFGGVEIGPLGATSLTSLQLKQDAVFAALPANVNFTTDPTETTQVVLAVRDDTFALDAAGRALIDGRDSAVLETVSQLDLGGAPALMVTDLDVRLSENFTIDDAFATAVNGIDQIQVETGLANSEALQGDGALQVDTSLSANVELVLHAGVAGTGNLDVLPSASLSVPNVSGNAITLRAGDGAGGVTGTGAAQVVIDSTATISTPEFTMHQDGAIGGSAGSRIHDVDLLSAGLRQTLRSDDSSVTLEELARDALVDTHLAIAGTSLDTSGLDLVGNGPLSVLSLDLGGIGNLTVDNTLLDSFDGASELVLRAGIVNPGLLSFVAGTQVEGNTIRLIASDGPGGNISSLITGSNLATFKKPGLDEAPDTFIFEQDSSIFDGNLPDASAFAGGTLPTTVGIRSSDSVVELTSPNEAPVDSMGRLVLGGQSVEIETDGDLAFAAGLTVEIRSDEIAFVAANTGNDAEVDLAGAMLTVFGHDTEAGGVDAGDFDPTPIDPTAAVGADSVSITQDADLTSDNLPDDIFVAGDPTVYQLTSAHGSIDIDDASKVDGSILALRLLDVPDTGDDGGRTIELSDSNPYNLESLVISHNRGLSFAADIVAADIVVIEAATAAQPNEHLTFLAGSSIAAKSIGLRAGATGHFSLDNTASELSIVDASELEVIFSDPEAIFEITQDGSLGNELPGTITRGGDAATMGISLLDVESRRGDVAVNGSDIDYAKTVDLTAGDFEPNADGNLTLTQKTGDLDLDLNFALLENLSLRGRNVTLRAEGDEARVLANSEKLTIFGPGVGTGLASPDSFTIDQTASFDVNDVAGTDRFDATSLLGLPYTLRSLGKDFTLNDAFADTLAVFDVTLDSGPAGSHIRIDASADTTTAPVFAGLTAIAENITIDAARFETLGSQQYQGDTLLGTAPSTTLGALLDVRFTGTVDSSAPGANSLVVNSGRTVQFSDDVGGTASLADLTIQFASVAGSVEFGSSSDSPSDLTDTQLQLTGDLTIQSIDSTDYAFNRSESVIVRQPSPSVASILKRSSGRLQIAADNVLVAQGEKWTTVGTLDIDATNEVQVGDVTAQGVEITADHLTVMRRARSSLLDTNGRTDGDAGVDWVANEFVLEIANGVGVGGSGPLPVVGTPDGSPIHLTDGTALPFASAEIFPKGGTLSPQDLVFDSDPSDEVPAFVLDSRPRGPAASDFSRVLTPPVTAPGSDAPLDSPPIQESAFREIGIEARPPSGRESAGRLRAAAILDDASHGWRQDRRIAHVTSPRLDPEHAAEATRLFGDVFGHDMANAPEIRAALGDAVADYREDTGARRVLGFELRRFLRNRPSTQFEAHQLLERLDRLFSAHRRSGLVPGEYRPVQREWVEAITPIGIDSAELAEAIHPSRYVRGSDVLDVFGK